MKRLFLTIISFTFITGSFSQELKDTIPDSNRYYPGRAYLIAGTTIGIYAGVMYTLNEFWYKDFPRSSFHFFDDNSGWMQVDKAGHFFTGYFVGRWGIEVVRWSGAEENKAIWYGGLIGSAFLTSIEILDAYSAQWGASAGDFVANSAGSLLAIGQELAWKDQRIQIKFSWRPVTYPAYARSRAEYLYGTSFQERLVKDYNGQSYWLSVNVASFIHRKTSIPKWLNVSLGYSAEGLLGAESNIAVIQGKEVGDYSGIKRYRQYFLSLDVDLTKIPTKSKLLKSLFETFCFLKIPAPAIEFNSLGKVRFYPVYY